MRDCECRVEKMYLLLPLTVLAQPFKPFFIVVAASRRLCMGPDLSSSCLALNVFISHLLSSSGSSQIINSSRCLCLRAMLAEQVPGPAPNASCEEGTMNSRDTEDSRGGGGWKPSCKLASTFRYSEPSTLHTY